MGEVGFISCRVQGAMWDHEEFNWGLWTLQMLTSKRGMKLHRTQTPHLVAPFSARGHSLWQDLAWQFLGLFKKLGFCFALSVRIFLETASMAVECHRWFWSKLLDVGCGHEVGMLQIPIRQQTKVRDVRATTMDGGGFAAGGDLTLGGIAGAQV